MMQIASERPWPFESSAQRLVEALPQPAFVKTLDLRIIASNAPLERLLEFPVEDLKGCREEQFLDFSSIATIQQIDASTIDEAQNRSDEAISLRLHSDRTVYLQTRRSPLATDDGEVWGILCIYLLPSETEKQLAKDNQALRQQLTLLDNDLKNAALIQEFMLTPAPLNCPFLQVSQRYRFMEPVGGDFIHCQSASAHRLSLLQADLTGHGVSAALFTSLLSFVCQEASPDLQGSPSEYLSYLDAKFHQRIPNGFFTAFACNFEQDPMTRNVTARYCSAAHPAAVIVRKDGIIQLLKQSECAIGLIDFVSRQEMTISLEPGDRLYSFSDGFIECCNPGNQEFGLSGIAKALQAGRSHSLPQSIDLAYRRVENFQADPTLQDDMSIVGIEVI